MPESVRVSTDRARAAVLEGLPVTEHRMTLAGIQTAVLVGGDGPPMVLLPGPGESALFWTRVIPALAATHRIIAPDLPGTGNSGQADIINADRVLAWLDALIERTCEAPPVLVGHIVGGGLAARYAVQDRRELAGLVLVDSLGLRRFLPAPAFAFRLLRFLRKPTAQSYEPFLDQCMFDAEAMKKGFGARWQPFLDDYLAGIQDQHRKTAMGELIKHLGAKRIPAKDLASITVPTTLIWGRHDKATPVKVAQKASARYGWPLHVIEAAGDDPKLEQPEAFLRALRTAVG